MTNSAKKITDIQRAYLSRVVDYVKNTVYGGVGYHKLGKLVSGTGTNMNQTTLMRWHKASDGIGLPEDKLTGFVRIVPNPTNLRMLVQVLPEAEDTDIETIYLSVLEKSGIDTGDLSEDREETIPSELGRKAGYALPINKQMFNYVFNITPGNSKMLPDQLIGLAERVSYLEDVTTEAEGRLGDIELKIKGIREAFTTFKQNTETELASFHTSGTLEYTQGLPPDTARRILVLEDKLAEQTFRASASSSNDLGNLLKGLISTQTAAFERLIKALQKNDNDSVLSIPEVEGKIQMVDPLKEISQCIKDSGQSLAQIAEFSAISVSDLETLLSGGYDSILMDSTASFKDSFKAKAVLNGLIEALNALTGATLDKQQVLNDYTKVAQGEGLLKIHHPELTSLS